MGVPYEYTHMGRPIRVWVNIRIWGRTDIQVSTEVSLVPFTAQCVDSIRRLGRHGYAMLHGN